MKETAYGIAMRIIEEIEDDGYQFDYDEYRHNVKKYGPADATKMLREDIKHTVECFIADGTSPQMKGRIVSEIISHYI